MKFRIISIKNNSVRVSTGIVTFDVEVICGDKLQIKIPPNIFIANAYDFRNLAGAVLGHYNNSVGDNNNEYNSRKSH